MSQLWRDVLVARGGRRVRSISGPVEKWSLYRKQSAPTILRMSKLRGRLHHLLGMDQGVAQGELAEWYLS